MCCCVTDPRTPRRVRSRALLLRTLLAAALGVSSATAASAQAPGAELRPGLASPLVPTGDWSWDAARRLDVLGLVAGGFDRGKGLVTRAELALLFDSAVARAERDRPEMLSLARALRDRFADEFPGVSAPRPSGRVRLEAGYVGAGYERLAGRVGTGVGYLDPDWTGALPIPDTAGAVLEGSVSASLAPALALSIEPAVVAGRPQLRSGQIVGVVGRYLGVWAGRRTVAFGPGLAGGIVLSDAARLDGFGVFTAQPFRFPWLFHALGPVQMESFFSKSYGGDRIRDPFFVAFRGSIAPHPRFTVALNRAAMFAGRGNDPITLRRMMFLFIGGTGHGESGAFANDVLSADFTWRPPVERVLPTVLYLEWGMDDSGGMWIKAPGLIGGASVAALPALPWLGVGLEAISFAPPSGYNTIWYRNWALRQGWADYGTPLGQPLAGEGKEASASLTATPVSASVRLRAQAFLRERTAGNLFAPQRLGRSHGGRLRLELTLPHRLELDADASAERGDAGWTTSALSTSARLRF